ncbi:SdiA-regulated domain-containing protein [Stutzerimonas kirkiae]|uniref:DNA-binding protein n=1 Tax=Stutzerimonas kirkiae TaxID=2211392 RepID=A0A4Q9RFZ8_9GAMM|nr:SdiA-regulated domain-containing protein [Stutzerimonas kirkiae]TBU99795.1 DNA-binding protein [Stutzerimonas kirkiae]TBV05273.1 DNA-binding protein [Stutzerimonas kirkiae]TBV11707.1 DNA-binding protein [Stutzerimonas kirkiae]TBV15364.1 DNA-binding protein [Stutzerimonas kirkiae]
MISIAKGMLGQLPVVRPWMWLSAAGFSGLFLLAAFFHLDDRLLFSIKTSWHESNWSTRSLWLPEYEVKIDALPVATVENNLSGLTYDERADHLWAVVNNPEELLAIGKDGRFIARYPLQGFSDVEGVTYLGDGLLVVAEERRQSLVIVPVPKTPGPLQREDYQSITLGLHSDDNNGFEGLGYDRAGDRLFVVKEHSPRKLYEIQGLRDTLAGRLGLKIIDRESWIADKEMATDLASVHFDERTGHLVLLSEEANMMLELDAEGNMVSFRSLWRGFAGLEESVPQAEGLTFDDDGNLYLVSEPNLFYAFERKREG